MKKLWQNPFNLFLAVIATINILPILAPILMKLSEQPSLRWLEAPARAIYLVYSFSCHQFHHRSLHIHDYQCAWCSRDMGIWGGILTAAIASRTGQNKPLAWYWTLPFIIPIALDGGIQTVDTVGNLSQNSELNEPNYVSNNLVRFLTGAIFGLGVGLFIAPRLREMVFAEIGSQAKNHLRTSQTKFARFWQWIAQSNLRLVFSLLLILMGVYTTLVGLWSATSTEYMPSDFLDTAVRTPAGSFFVRRENAVCPAGEEDLLALDCFFSVL